MGIQGGQYNDVVSAFGSVDKSICSILAEGGSDNGKSFNGSFLVKIKGKGVYRFEDGKMLKKVQ